MGGVRRIKRGDCVFTRAIRPSKTKSQSNQMTTSNTAGRSMFRKAAVGIAAVIAPLAIVIGISGFNAPAAEARSCQTYCTGNWCQTNCN